MHGVETFAFDVIDEIKSAKRVEDVCELLKRTTSNYGFNCFLITGVPLPGETLAQHVVLSGWSEEWMGHYNGRDYVHVDPVVHQIRQSTQPFCWSDVRYDPRKDQRAHQVMMEAKECGMSDGFTVPIYGYDGYQACVTMGGDPEVSVRELSALHLISLVTFSAVRDLDGRFAQGGSGDALPLTEREAEALRWASVGKTAWEISAILGISERTAEHHLSSVARKLNASNRVHAVALALRSGVIH